MTITTTGRHQYRAITQREAAALCGLTLHPWPHATTNPARLCELRDATGVVVFAGERWPDSWQFMRQQYGLRSKGRV